VIARRGHIVVHDRGQHVQPGPDREGRQTLGQSRWRARGSGGGNGGVSRRASGPFGYRRGFRPRLCQYPGPGVSTVCRRLFAFHDHRPAPSPQLTPSPPTCSRNGPRRKVLRR
jgi:hypothetical protein